MYNVIISYKFDAILWDLGYSSKTLGDLPFHITRHKTHTKLTKMKSMWELDMRVKEYNFIH